MIKNKGLKFQKIEGARLCKSFKDDCVIRSISFALNMKYKDVFNDLMALGLEVGAYPNHDKVWEKYLNNKGWVKNKCPRDKEGKLIKLENWATAPRVAVVKNSGHLTAIENGYILDEWDCSYRPVNTYWTPEQ